MRCLSRLLEGYLGVCIVLFLIVVKVQSQTFDLNYKIQEELPVNSVVGNIGTDSNIFQLLSSEDFASLRYRILLYPDTHNNYFNIVNTTGVLKTASPIDRELICFYETTCKLSLHVAAQTESGQQFYTFKVAVFVQDINDNSPTFSMSTLIVKIEEDAAMSTPIPILSATDRDILNNTLQKYSLVTPSDTFGLKVTRNLDDSLTPQLYVKALMDRERQPYYYLKVMALDGGTPARSGELAINVTLNDVNDNAPRFSKQIYDESVAEISPIGHRVMTLSATDEDIGNNGRITFSLGARQSEESFNTFRVVANTGDILSLRDLTPLQGQTMRLVVEAVDQGAKPQTAQAVVNIHIVDSVNNAPIIRMTIPPGSPVSRIIENASPGFVVAHFMVEDADSGDNGDVSCHLQDDTFGLQRLKKDEYKVTVYTNLDRERIPFYDVTVTCMDGGSPSMTTNVAFSVILEDANDNPPRFMKSVYRANISENVNSFILRLEAEDIDLGQNGSVSYRLGDVTPLVASYIYLNPSTGELTTKQMLDHELFKQLDFQVVAADSGTPSLSSTARVIIDVIDENDNIPRVPSGYYMLVPENKPIGTIIGVIHAIDPDEGSAGQVGYQLRSDNEATRLFNLSKSGELRTLRMFDREIRDAYSIDVLAWDYGESPLTNDLHIRILIADDNDHSPVLEYPRPSNKTVHMTMDARFNTTVAAVVATDQDVGENASLTYAILEGSRGVFDIEPRTGRVFVSRHLHSSDKGTYTVTLSVRDSGPNPLSTVGTLIVILTQGNGTAAYISFANNEHIIIAALLVGITIFIAIVVLLIVIRFIKKERQERRPKYTAGLPMEVKMQTEAHVDDVSSDAGPWRRYDIAKRHNGSVVSSDVAFEANDDILMFKMKLADQYKELEPEDKELGCHVLCHDDLSSNRTSVISEVDGAPEVSRNHSSTHFATFQGKPDMTHGSGFGNGQDHKEKVWRATLKDKMSDEILSSSSRETTGADSGRGPSEDGTQSRSSITEESMCLISPSHSLLRGANPRNPGNYSRPQSGAGYDPPPLLMTFQSNSAEYPGKNRGGSSHYMTRKDCGPVVSYPVSPSQRQLTEHGKDYTRKPPLDTVQVGRTDVTVHINHHGASPELSTKNNKARKMMNAAHLKTKESPKIMDLTNGPLKDSEWTYPTCKIRDVRLCSEPPVTEIKDNTVSPVNKRGVQETGPTSATSAINSSPNNTVYIASLDRSPGSKNRHIYPPSPRFLHSSQTPNSFRHNSNQQIYKDALSPAPQDPKPMNNRLGTFGNHDKAINMSPMSVHDKLIMERNRRDEGDATSGKYLVAHGDNMLGMPQTDVFI